MGLNYNHSRSKWTWLSCRESVTLYPPRSPELEPHYQMQSSVISRMLIGGVLPLCKEAVGVFYSLSHLMATGLPSWKLSKLDEPDMQDTAGEARMSSKVMYSYGPPHMAKQKQDNQLEHTYSSYVRIWDVALKACQRWWTIGRSGERGSGISVLPARHDDDDDDGWYEIKIKRIFFNLPWEILLKRILQKKF